MPDDAKLTEFTVWCQQTTSIQTSYGLYSKGSGTASHWEENLAPGQAAIAVTIGATGKALDQLTGARILRSEYDTFKDGAFNFATEQDLIYDCSSNPFPVGMTLDYSMYTPAGMIKGTVVVAPPPKG